MPTNIIRTLIAVAISTMAIGAHAEVTTGVTPANKLKWMAAPSSMPGGAQFATLYGDPSKGGPFVIRIKLPSGYKVAPHKHGALEMLTVISGELRYGVGEQFDPGAETFAHAMDFIVTPAETAHWVQANSETVLQLSSIGPFTITYVNPKDDPRTAQR